jgi:hypothetical protein
MANARGPTPRYAARHPRQQIDPAHGRCTIAAGASRGRAARGGAWRQKQISHWDRSAVEPDVDAPLDGDATADVAIVGGGFTGLSTALHGADKGLDCLVLEAERIGHGGSGRNVGLVNAGVWHPPAAVRKALGPTYGPRFVERFGAAPEYVFSLIENTRSAASRPQRHDPRGPCALRADRSPGAPRRMAAARRPGRDAGRGGGARHDRRRRFAGGLYDRRAGTVNPMGYVRGLARAALGAGARIATGVRVTGLARAATAGASRRHGARSRRVRGAGDQRLYRRPLAGPLEGLHADPLFPARHRTLGRRGRHDPAGAAGLCGTRRRS